MHEAKARIIEVTMMRSEVSRGGGVTARNEVRVCIIT